MPFRDPPYWNSGEQRKQGKRPFERVYARNPASDNLGGWSRVESERCYVYGAVVDLRKGASGLIALIGEAEPEVLYLFSNRTRALLKFVAVDRAGVWCGTRRRHHSRFAWPESPTGRQRLTAEELACLLVGEDIKKLRLRKALVGQVV